MPDEKIEVEWVATATKMNQTLERLNTKLDKQEAKLEKIGRTSKAAAGCCLNEGKRKVAEFRILS